jgi:hypothetical protein
MTPYQLLCRILEQPLPGHMITVGGVGDFMICLDLKWIVFDSNI